jgi:hypothetical protein
MADDDFIESSRNRAIPIRPDAPSAGVVRKFKPWHKPRKQWVRRHQWHSEVVRLIDESHFADDARIFRYLSMPGEDLLDVRVLREACEAAGLKLRFTGLNDVDIGSPDDIQLNLSESAVRGLPAIHPGSRILREKFQAIAEPASLAYAEVQGSGPFNAINIDLCDHLALREQNTDDRTIIDALAEIIRVQLRHAMQPWLLFITTRIRPGHVQAANLQALVQAIRDNIGKSEDFAARTAHLLKREGDELAAALDDPDALTPSEFKDLFCLGFGKWLLSYISQAQPARALQMLPSCYYSVFDGQPDMLSLAFRCDVVLRPPVDAYKIVPAAAVPAEQPEVEMAMSLVEETIRLADLDGVMAADSTLFEAMTGETETLLRSAQYPVDDDEKGYRNWLEKQAAAAAARAASGQAASA